MSSYFLLIILCLFLLKHFLADFILQSKAIISGKGYYGHPGGFAHIGVHLGLSCLILFLTDLSMRSIILALLFEGVIHYHIDWGRESIARRWEITPDRSDFWRLLGLDQLLHQLTYVLIVAFWLA